jgi:hypothetical protein
MVHLHFFAAGVATVFIRLRRGRFRHRKTGSGGDGGGCCLVNTGRRSTFR